MSNAGFDFVIGGKNKAGAAMDSVEKSLQRLETKTSKLTSVTSKLTAVTGALAAGYAAVKAGLAMIGGIEKLNAAYDMQAEAVQGLETALRLQGAETEKESERLQKFASELQAATGVGDELTLSMMRQATMLGVASEDLDDMAKAAIGLGEAMGTSAEQGMESMRRAQEGNFAQFERTFPAMRQMQSDTEKLAFLSEVAAKGLEAKAEASNRVAGMGERANNAIGDLMEVVGSLLAPVRVLISQGLIVMAEALQNLLAPAAAYATAILENIGPMMDWVKEKVIAGVNLMIGAFTFFEVVIGNFDKIWQAMVDQTELYLWQMVGTVKHVFTTVIPEYAAWFGRNFSELMRAGMDLAVTVVTNHVKKLVDTFRTLWDFIASWGQTDVLGELGAIAGRSYLEGFEHSVEALPDIAGRKMTDREKELAERIGKVGADLGEEFATKFNSRMIKAGEGLGDTFDKEIDLSITDKLDAKLGGAGGGNKDATLSAQVSRLGTRGPARQEDTMKDVVDQLKRLNATSADTSSSSEASESELAEQTNLMRDQPQITLVGVN